MGLPVDVLGRPLRDVRISVTDRCNFRCPYCLPRAAGEPTFLPRAELLSYEEIGLLVEVLARLGASKVRLTGGEPLLRRDLASLVARISGVSGIEDVALTTNGSLLAGQAAGLAAAGLRRVTVSLDSLDERVFAVMSDARVPLARVLDGIAAARAAGLAPVKLNTVVRRGVNETGLLDLVDYAREFGHPLRFIEYMDVGTTNAWDDTQVVPGAEILARISARYPLSPIPGPATEVARRWAFADGRGEIGLIMSVTEPFCTGCVRARVTAVGELFTCLFAPSGTDLRAVLRSGLAGPELEAALTAAITGVWRGRTDRYSQLRDPRRTRVRAEMSYLGG